MLDLEELAIFRTFFRIIFSLTAFRQDFSMLDLRRLPDA